MFGRKKNIAPLKNQPRGPEEELKPRKGFRLFPSRKEKKKEKRVKKEQVKPKTRFGVMRAIMTVLDGSFLQQEWMVRSAPLAVLIFALTILAIGNNYVAQRKAKKIDSIKHEIKDLRDEYISTKSQLMYSTKMSEVARQLEARKIKQPVKPPFKIRIKEKEGGE